MYTYALIDNGRELDNVEPGVFATEAEALADGERELDMVCPRGSPHRRYYRVEARAVDRVATAATWDAPKTLLQAVRYAAFLECLTDGKIVRVPVLPPVGRKYGNRSTWPSMETAQAAVERKGRYLAPARRGLVYACDGAAFTDRSPDWSIAL